MLVYCALHVLLQVTATATNAIGIWMSEQDDDADTLQTDGTHYAIQEDALVDLTFLQQLKRQRDMHIKQLRSSFVEPDPMTTKFSSEMQSLYPLASPFEDGPHISSSADHDACTSSVQAYSPIFTSNHAKFVVLPSSPDFRLNDCRHRLNASAIFTSI